MAGDTNCPHDENGKLNPFQQYFGISLEELRMERRAQELTRPKNKPRPTRRKVK